MKKIFSIIILAFAASVLMATDSPYNTPKSLLMEHGREFYNEKNYSAAYRYLVDYLKQAKNATIVPNVTQGPSSVEEIREAEYMMALSSYYLRNAEAINNLQAYVVNYPYASEIDRFNLYIGILEIEEGKYKEALKLLEQVRRDKLAEEDVDALLFYRGYAYVERKKYEEASYEFSQLLKRNTEEYNIPAHYYYGYSQYRMGNYSVALENILVAEDDPNFKHETPLLLCKLYFLLENCEKSMQYAEKIMSLGEINKDNAEVYKIVAVCKFNNKEYSKTIELLEKYQKLSKKMTREDWYILGMSYYNTEKYDKAVKTLAKSTSEKDKLGQNSYFHTAMSYLKLSDKKNARMSFDKASRLNFDKQIQEDALYNYALLTYELSYSAFNEYVEAFERFLKEFPDSKHKDKVHEYLLSSYLTTTNYSQAYASIKKLNSNDRVVKEAEQRVLFGMATDAIANRKYSDAMAHFQTLLSEKSYNADVTARAHFWYGECLYRSKKYDEAEEQFNLYLKKTVSIDQDEYRFAQYNTAYIYWNKKDYKNALYWFRKYEKIEKVNPVMRLDALNRIGDCYFLQRDFDQALKSYNQSLAVGGTYAGVDYALYQKAFVLGLQKKYNEKIDALTDLQTRFPKSDWNDDALFEIGKSYIALDKTNEAIASFEAISEKYPASSPIVRKAQLQIAMLQYNSGKVSEAAVTYKKVAVSYPNTEEAATALSALESIMVDTNKVDEFNQLAQQLGKSSTSKEDSLQYKAAEKIYFKNNYAEASTVLEKYINMYPQGKYNALAQYYLANCYYYQKKYTESLDIYAKLLENTENPNIEFSLQRASSIAFDLQKYEDALSYFTKLDQIGSVENKQIAKLGVLRCAYMLKDYNRTIEVSSDVINAYAAYDEIVAEARYNRFKSYQAMSNMDAAYNDLVALSADTRNIYGAEAKYELANYYYSKKQLDKAEAEVFSYIEKGTPHQHYLAKSFILLSDIYITKENYFEAKQYLLSLKDNYVADDEEVSTAITSRLELIAQKESETISNQ
jgi:TolA-binding protein